MLYLLNRVKSNSPREEVMQIFENDPRPPPIVEYAPGATFSSGRSLYFLAEMTLRVYQGIYYEAEKLRG